jgi:hypothetical protein
LILGREAEDLLRVSGEGGRAEAAAANFVEAARHLGKTHLGTYERQWALERVSREDLPELALQLHRVVRAVERQPDYTSRYIYFERPDRWPPIFESYGED